jgi:hypothetical protein
MFGVRGKKVNLTDSPSFSPLSMPICNKQRVIKEVLGKLGRLLLREKGFFGSTSTSKVQKDKMSKNTDNDDFFDHPDPPPGGWVPT